MLKSRWVVVGKLTWRQLWYRWRRSLEGVEYFVGVPRKHLWNLLEFVASGCDQSNTVQLRIYEGFDVGQPSSHIRLPDDDTDLNLGPKDEDDERGSQVTLTIDGTHPNRTISLNEASLTWDSTTEAWLIPPLE